MMFFKWELYEDSSLKTNHKDDGLKIFANLRNFSQVGI